MSASPEEVAATTAETPPASDESPEPKQGAESAPAVKDPDEKAKPSEGFTKRIDELTRYWRETERDRDYWREQAQKAREPVKAPEVEFAPKTLADFAYDETKFQTYLFSTAQERAVEAAEKRMREAQNLALRQERQQDYAERETKYASSVDDYDAVTRQPNLAISESMAETIMESENGPAIAYYLGKNPRQAEQISRLPPLQQAREIGRIEAKLSDKPPVKVSTAPEPATRIEALDSSITPKPDTAEGEKLSDAAWLKAREKQVSRRK